MNVDESKQTSVHPLLTVYESTQAKANFTFDIADDCIWNIAALVPVIKFHQILCLSIHF